ncbi:MAG: hypothetical protein D6805_05260 [Planctomycetota bacterium]|nr:MAG: hypothetical protein D6805_05260 [Planctomycetota bacterium]
MSTLFQLQNPFSNKGLLGNKSFWRCGTFFKKRFRKEKFLGSLKTFFKKGFQEKMLKGFLGERDFP